eukprot:g58045.t1
MLSPTRKPPSSPRFQFTHPEKVAKKLSFWEKLSLWQRCYLPQKTGLMGQADPTPSGAVYSYRGLIFLLELTVSNSSYIGL